MNIGFQRIVLERWIDIDKSPNTWGNIKLPIKNDSQSGIYPLIIVPENLKGRKVVIIPLNEDNEPMKIEELTKI